MSRGLPSMTALLGLLAVAGFQNRDKISEWIGGVASDAKAAADRPKGLDNVLGPWRDQSRTSAPSTADATGGLLGGGLKDLVDHFRTGGHSETVDSWVNTGPNRTMDARQLEGAIGSDTMDSLTRQTGLSKDEILSRLSKALPDAIDRYTPDGRLPA
jgi:uncharacterized protein YidB (DUF937 family)